MPAAPTAGDDHGDDQNRPPSTPNPTRPPAADEPSGASRAPSTGDSPTARAAVPVTPTPHDPPGASNASDASDASDDVPQRRGPWRRLLTIRARLTLTYAGLFLAGGSVLVAAIVFAQYSDLHGPLPNDFPSRLDPDHDRFVGVADQIRDTATSHLLRHALELLLLMVLISALVGWWVAGRMLRRLAAITAAARAASDTTLHERLNLGGPDDELKELADTFDSMLERLDASFAAQRRFVANASHELRTPLAVTRTAVEVTLAKPTVTDVQWRTMARDVAQSTEHAQRLLEGLLYLARSQQTITDTTTDDLADLAAEGIDQIHAAARDAGLRIVSDLLPAPVSGNVALLARAVANLLENAVQYNVPSGTITVRTWLAGDGWSTLSVTSDGARLVQDEVEQFFEAFHRGPRTRRQASGTGLGLSIVKAVAEAHGGQLTAAARPAGGLRVTLRLPAI
jgi:two-component system sensor histidine kinase VanS